MEKEAVYIDFDCLLGFSNALKTHLSPDEQKALKSIWTLYNEEKIRLVTSRDDMNLDIIMWLNSQGCCVTDTLNPLEAIKEFERWEKADKDTVKAWRRIFYYFDRIEPLPSQYNDTSPYMQGFPEELFTAKSEGDWDAFFTNLNTVKQILKACANAFSDIFSEKKWQDLSCIDYSLNWTLLEWTIKKLGLAAQSQVLDKEDEKRIFGLLNRVVNLSKKSCKTPRLSPEHIDFIVNTVINKYLTGKTRYNKHIINCISFNIEQMLTTDKRLMELFKRIKEENKDKSTIFQKNFNILTPHELQLKILKK
ncbi:MAG TPA: hypothetical protein PK800_02060 [Syntrophorhabdaceae bacterium]|nr:hypothetical protein [Syntrophorhabdaceae bacterium]